MIGELASLLFVFKNLCNFMYMVLKKVEVGFAVA